MSSIFNFQTMDKAKDRESTNDKKKAKRARNLDAKNAWKKRLHDGTQQLRPRIKYKSTPRDTRQQRNQPLLPLPNRFRTPKSTTSTSPQPSTCSSISPPYDKQVNISLSRPLSPFPPPPPYLLSTPTPPPLAKTSARESLLSRTTYTSQYARTSSMILNELPASNYEPGEDAPDTEPDGYE